MTGSWAWWHGATRPLATRDLRAVASCSALGVEVMEIVCDDG